MSTSLSGNLDLSNWSEPAALEAALDPNPALTAADEAFLANADVATFAAATIRLLEGVEQSGHKTLTIAHVRDLFRYVLSLSDVQTHD